MSVVIAIKDGDHVLVGCDSQATYGGYKTRLTVEHNKAWYIDDCPNGVMGSVGSLRALQLIQVTPNLIDELAQYRNEVDFNYVVTELYGRLADTLKHYCVIPSDMVPLLLPNDFIFAYKDKAWLIDADGATMELVDYLCTGSGEEIARGILESTKDLPAMKRIEMAIRACSDLTTSVDNNVCIFSTAAEEELVEDIDKPAEE